MEIEDVEKVSELIIQEVLHTIFNPQYKSTRRKR
jgi:hypothetical protein